MLTGFEGRTISEIWSFGNKDKKALKGKEIDDSVEIRNNDSERKTDFRLEHFERESVQINNINDNNVTILRYCTYERYQ